MTLRKEGNMQSTVVNRIWGPNPRLCLPFARQGTPKLFILYLHGPSFDLWTLSPIEFQPVSKLENTVFPAQLVDVLEGYME